MTLQSLSESALSKNSMMPLSDGDQKSRCTQIVLVYTFGGHIIMILGLDIPKSILDWVQIYRLM